MPAAFRDRAYQQALALVAQLPAYDGAAPAPAFQPTDIAGLALWLDASDASTLTITSSPDVDQWDDKSGNGNHVSQSTAASKPHTGGSINGRNAIVFDAVDDYLKNSTAGGTFTGTDGAIFAIWRSPAALSASFATVLGSADEASGSKNFLVGPHRGTGVRNISIQTDAGPGADAVRGDTTITTNTDYLLLWTKNGGAWVLEVDAVTQTLTVVAGSNSGRWFAGVPDRDSFSVGVLIRNTISLYLGGSIGELLVYDGVTLTTQNFTDLETYFTAKWGKP